MCVCVCACDTWYSLHVIAPVISLGSATVSSGTAMGNGPRDFVELGQVLEVAKCGCIIIVVVIIILMIFIIII